jgi:hypothetical protein
MQTTAPVRTRAAGLLRRCVKGLCAELAGPTRLQSAYPRRARKGKAPLSGAFDWPNNTFVCVKNLV